VSAPGDNLLAFAAWLGAIVDRLRKGVAPIPSDAEELARDCASFGVGSTLAKPRAPDWSEERCPQGIVPLIREIHLRIKGTAFERQLMGELLHIVPPDDVLEDMLSRDVLVDQIGHLPLADSLLWRLADQVPEALLTLGKRRFLNAPYTADQFEEVLYAYPSHYWLFSSLAQLECDSPEKLDCLARYLAALPDRSTMMRHSSPTLHELVRSHGG
jgi:hypothetical protein